MLLTADSVVESMKRLNDEIAEKEQQKKQRQIQRQADKGRREKEKRQKQAEREEKKQERQIRDVEDRTMMQNKKRHTPCDTILSNHAADDDKENQPQRYIDISIDTSQLEYTHTQRVLGEIQSTTQQQSSMQDVISHTKRYRLMNIHSNRIRLHSI